MNGTRLNRYIDTYRSCVTLSVRAIFLIAALASFLPTEARAEFRHALVIGQSKYKLTPIAAPGRDVTAVADALVRQGFTVTRAENVATIKEFEETIKKFARSVPTSGTALVYYSGKTITVPLPTAKNPPSREPAFVSLDGGLHPLSAVLRPLVVSNYSPYGNGFTGLQCGSRTNVIILDAAPVQPSTALPGDKSSADASGGLALVPPADTLVVLRPTDAPVPAPESTGLSLLAEKLIAGLSSKRTLDATLTGLSTRSFSSLTESELSRLAVPASRAVSPPNKLKPGSRPGEEWVDANGMVFCWCPPGQFTIGSPSNELDRQRDELQADVSFAEGFWMAKYEMSYRESIPLGGGIYLSTGEHKLHPVNLAGGLNLVKLLAAANATAPTGWEYGLPTEAEWEYAARAGTTTAYSFGSNPADLIRYGNFADRSLRDSGFYGERAKTHKSKPETPIFFGDRQSGLYSYAHPIWNDSSVSMARVGSYLPNPWGLCDMHGNVAELTSTIYDPLRLGPVVAPEKRAEWSAIPENKNYALGSVCKGGSWASIPGSCRSAFRGWASTADNIIGLRLILRPRSGMINPVLARWTTLVPREFTAKSGAKATPAADGSLLVTGKAVAGDTYTVTCPVPPGVDPRAVRLEVLADPGLPRNGPGRHPTAGNFSVAEVSIAAVRAGGFAAPINVLALRSDPPDPNAANLIDGRLDTVWSGIGDGKNREMVFTIGLPSRTGGDGAIWRYPAARDKPLTSLVITIVHSNAPALGAATLGKFRLVVLHDERGAVQKEAAP